MVTQYVSKVFTKIFGSRNERLVKSYLKRVEAVNSFESEMRKLDDEQLRQRKDKLAKRVMDEKPPANEWVPEALAIGREAMDRAIGIRSIFNPEHKFDVEKLPTNLQSMYQQIASKAAELEDKPVKGGEPAPGWMQVEIPVEMYNAVREIYPESRPPFRSRPFDVQLIGGMVLSEGKIAEMKTGEGKTIVAPLACFLASLEGLRCHVVTTNDYLVQRDRDWVFPFYYHLGLTVGAIHPFHMQPGELKAQAYTCDVVYGTNSEFGFDYLRDNMKLSTDEQVQKHRDFVIVDEVDSILIDEARTPLIISGPAHSDAPRYELADTLARDLIQKQKSWNAADQKVQQCMMKIKSIEGDIRNTREKDRIPEMRKEMERLEKEDLPQVEEERARHTQFYEVEMDKKAAHLTHDGVAEAQKKAGIGSFYVGNNIDMPHLLENALRAHTVYQRDKDYVVQGGEVIIVDEFTGRLMIGRQWSDGLHQAVEAKERVKIKEETQTLATVTIQNFFKLYKRLAGMTGTAMTEATEFDDIYELDVVGIPTNVPVIRDDRDDLIYISEKDKWYAILDEIKRMHDVGRPVLVGTTSVEKSEMISQMLEKKHSIPHEVLNAKQHEREAHVVQNAGALGAVMIATNMAGRGTDIRLQKIPRETLVEHWQRRNILPKEARANMADEEIARLAERHMLAQESKMSAKEVAELSDEDVHTKLLRRWVKRWGWQVGWMDFKWWKVDKWFSTPPWHDEDFVDRLDDQTLEDVLDHVPGFMLHRLEMFPDTEELGGLHIIGTERHEARRIDNQLRGRAGRQGDQGSSRFFISLEDDLMKLFAGKMTMTALSKLGMKEGDALEHKWISKSVERAQRKVEERNYQTRKNLLEYDEVMEHQRNGFYDVRQAVLEGREIDSIIFNYIGDATQDAVSTYLDPDYIPMQIAEWCQNTLDVSIEPYKLKGYDDVTSLSKIIRDQAVSDVQQVVETTLGEYMSEDSASEDWDLKGLSSWAMSRFGVNLSQKRLQQMDIEQVRETLVEAAQEQVAKKDVSGVGQYLEPLLAEKRLAEWARQKFGLELNPDELSDREQAVVVDLILDKAREAYRRREIEYPVEFALEMTAAAAQQDRDWALDQLAKWSNDRWDVNWSAADFEGMDGEEIYNKLLAEAESWADGEKLQAMVNKKVVETNGNPEKLAAWCQERWGRNVEVETLSDLSIDERKEELFDEGRASLRRELTQLERYVLLQILDTAWKDHLYGMDRLKDSVSLQSYAEKDPRIEYKRQGSDLFGEMQASVRDRVTDLIFRAKLTPNVEARDVYGEQSAEHADAESALSAAATSSQGTAEQRADLAAAQRAGGGDDDRNLSRRERRAMKHRDKSSTKATGKVKTRKRKR